MDQRHCVFATVRCSPRRVELQREASANVDNRVERESSNIGRQRSTWLDNRRQRMASVELEDRLHRSNI